MFALDFLRIGLAHFVLLGIEMPLVGSPSIRVKPRDPKGLKEFLPLQKNVVLPPPEPIRSHFPRVVINGVPQPARIRFPRDVRPHFIQLGTEATTPLQLLRPPEFDLHLFGTQDC